MYLSTGSPEVRQDGDRIVATIPSGNSTIEISLSYAHGTRLGETMVRCVRSAIQSDNVAASADVVPLGSRRKRKA